MMPRLVSSDGHHRVRPFTYGLCRDFRGVSGVFGLFDGVVVFVAVDQFTDQSDDDILAMGSGNRIDYEYDAFLFVHSF